MALCRISSWHCVRRFLRHTATHCNTLQNTATHCSTSYSGTIMSLSWHCVRFFLQHTATRCNALQTLQHTATHCNTSYSGIVSCFSLGTVPVSFCDTLQHIATHCNTLQHTATHCNVRQHIVYFRLLSLSWHCIRLFLQHTMYMYGDSCENLLEILAVVMILSPMSSVCGIHFRAFSLFFMSEAESSLSP
jgi:hypothetical protein